MPLDPQVSLDELDFTDDHLYVHKGHAFTGTAVEFDSTGRLVCELEIVGGKEEGWAREYDVEGRTIGETPYVGGRRHGEEREWFVDGRLKVLRRFELGIMMQERVWNEKGELIEQYDRPPDDYLYQAVQAARATRSG